MEKELHHLVLVFAFGISVFSFFSTWLILTGREVQKTLATGTQAVEDLKSMMGDLATTIGDAVQEFSDVLVKIQQNNGSDPAAVEGLTQQGRTLIDTLAKAVADVKAALNTPTPTPQTSNPVIR